MTENQKDKEKAVEVSFDELEKAAMEVREKYSGAQEKTPKLGSDDINRIVTIKKAYKMKSDFYQPAVPSETGGPGTPAKGNQFFHFGILLFEDGSERMKSFNGWDMEAIATGAKQFRIGTQEYKGGFKLVLKPIGQKQLGEAGKPAPIAARPKIEGGEGYI